MIIRGDFLRRLLMNQRMLKTRYVKQMRAIMLCSMAAAGLPTSAPESIVRTFRIPRAVKMNPTRASKTPVCMMCFFAFSLDVIPPMKPHINSTIPKKVGISAVMLAMPVAK